MKWKIKRKKLTTNEYWQQEPFKLPDEAIFLKFEYELTEDMSDYDKVMVYMIPMILGAEE